MAPDVPWEIGSKARSFERKDQRSKVALTITGVVICGLVLIVLVIIGAATLIQSRTGALDRLKSEMTEVTKTSNELESVWQINNSLMKSDASKIDQIVTDAKLNDAKEIAVAKRDELENEKSAITSTLADIGTPTDREAGNNAITLVNKQLLLIDRFEQIFEYASPYIALKADLNAGLAKLVEADSADREASELLLKQNDEDARKSIDASNNASSLAQEAKASFEKAQEDNRENGMNYISDEELQKYITYCQLFIDSQGASVGVANAYINKNSQEIDSQNKTYNDLKEQADSISGTWSMQITEVLDDAYSQRRESDVDGFTQDLKERDSILQTVKTYLEKD